MSNDSGLVHVAAAMGTPTIGIFGPTSAWHWAPLNPLAAVIETRTEVPCRPCHKPVCRLEHHRCMRDISADQVFAAAQAALATSAKEVSALPAPSPTATTARMADPRDDITAYFRRSHEVIAQAAGDAELMAAVLAIAERIAASFRAGGKLLLAGNGGSAADAQHIAAEFLSRFKLDRTPLPAIALTTDTSVLTAVGNDYGFEQVFERQVRGLGRPGDVFIAISTSGRSPNVLARAQGRARDRRDDGRLHRRRRRRDARALRSRAGGAVGGDRADPAGAHHRRARDLRAGRARPVWPGPDLSRWRRNCGPPPSSTATA